MPQMNKGGKFIFGQSIIQGQKTRRLRAGVYLFAIMEWVSAIGYRMFPLSDSGYAGAFQDVMHMVVTALVVLLSIVSLSVIVSAGLKDKSCRFYGVCAAIALVSVFQRHGYVPILSKSSLSAISVCLVGNRWA